MSTVRVHGASPLGAGAELVTVEALFEPGDCGGTEVRISGLPDPIIREGRGRWLCALEAHGLGLRQGRLHLNLVPAGRRKSGETLDLPLALAAAAAAGHLDPRWLEDTLFLGEVGIDGRLHAVAGGLAAAELARQSGLARIAAPPGTAREAACQPQARAFAAEDLGELVRWLAGLDPERAPCAAAEPPAAPPLDPSCLDAVRGHATGKRALAVAAAGGHALLFVGPPGTGKSLLARCLPALLPPLALPEAIEVTRVLSATGKWPGGLAWQRPFRAPHHTISYAGLIGGGAPPVPGEITLAHRGVLFLDELPEFHREALEGLRQPLEAGRVLVSRAGRQVEMPARFQLIAAMNPCPCGYLGHPRQPCRCPPALVQRYRSRISGPLLDRIGLRVELPPPDLDELSPSARAERPADAAPSAASGDPSLRRVDSGAQLQELVERARVRMRARQGPRANADLEASELDECSALDARGRRLLESAMSKQGISARAVQGLRRVARTLADLAGSERVEALHLAEALALRAPIWR